MSNTHRKTERTEWLRITESEGGHASFVLHFPEGQPPFLVARDEAHAVFVDIAPEDEAALLDVLTNRANAKRDLALKELHRRRYQDQGQVVRYTQLRAPRQDPIVYAHTTYLQDAAERRAE